MFAGRSTQTELEKGSLHIMYRVRGVVYPRIHCLPYALSLRSIPGRGGSPNFLNQKGQWYRHLYLAAFSDLRPPTSPLFCSPWFNYSSDRKIIQLLWFLFCHLILRGRGSVFWFNYVGSHIYSARMGNWKLENLLLKRNKEICGVRITSFIHEIWVTGGFSVWYISIVWVLLGPHFRSFNFIFYLHSQD